MSSNTGPQAGEHIDYVLELLATDPASFQAVVNQYAGAMAEHLVGCEACQVKLTLLLQKLTDTSVPGSKRQMKGQELLRRLKTVIVRSQVRKQLPAYVTAFSERGEPEANKLYPMVAAHLLECETCGLEVLARLAVLQLGED